ncbi:hypothetical protein [Robertmurraya korlensis]|uniref:hypothetical protein n=1 Tax=Robertmurraya korlensis TaxID=519977 RepID=UPI00082445BA|nr:hypothetical protein [Robertmurraya korlensis]
MVRKMVFVFVIGLMLNACHKDIPDPEVKKEISIEPMHTIRAENDVVVLGMKPDQSFTVQHHVKENNVYVECFIPDISFSNRNTRLIVSVDGKQKKVVTTAAFIIKGLSTGSHQIDLQVVENNLKRDDMKRNFEVLIP